MADPLFIGGVFAAGLLSFFAPCILPLLPVYVAYLSGAETGGAGVKDQRKSFVRLRSILVIRTLLFVVGLSTVFVMLGFSSGTLGAFVTDSRFIAVCGAVVIVFGVYQMGFFRLPILEREKKLSLRRIDRGGYSGAFLLGLTFSFGWTPCIGPILAAILSIATGEGSPTYGGVLMLVYAAGLAIPFLVLSVFSDLLLQRMKSLNKHIGVIKMVSGGILIVMGILLMTDELNTFAVWFEQLIN